jgi:ribosomal protein L11 methylase PrmA
MASFINISTNQIDSYILVVGEVNAHIQLIQSSRDFDDVVANIIGVI